MRTLLIDGDILAFQVAAVTQSPFVCPDEPDVFVVMLDNKTAKRNIRSHIKSLEETFEADKSIIALSKVGQGGKDNYRKSILPSYKDNRNRKGYKPVGLPLLFEWLPTEFKTYAFDTLEGDDVLGILATHPTLVKGDKIIVSIDKDMKTIPSKLIWRIEDGIKEITKKQADYWHLFQTLTGDTTDNYKGCPTVGPKTAEKILASDPSWETVVSTYESKGLTKEDALVQAQVARICRHENYDIEKGELTLWHPDDDPWV